ncbi:TonB-dependent receptor [Kordiimonas sp.]|uniref:TonB-dependent receptor n=1 Tax=Kordiimonas sp. TaxID=1970157 RepID=UPI003A907F89
MKRQMRAALCSSVALAAMAVSVPVIAQEITSSIRGSVVDANGSPLSGVAVVVTHVPSGSRSTYTTNSSGAFLARGLRPGGPYNVEVAAAGNYQGQSFEGLMLNVSEPLPLTIPLVGANASVEEIEVVASRIAAIRVGGATSYGADRIDSMPSVGRDLKDTMRANPFVSIDSGSSNALSIGGSNNRFNSLTVDGIRQDDDFGLNGNGYPTQRSPISIDTVEQVSVAPAPFNVEFGKFTGGQINVVTKSGTNEFHGTAFYQYRDDSLAGDKSQNLDGSDRDVDLGDFENKFWGATLGGPIIKDKLFFFGAYEKFEGTTPNTTGAQGSSYTNQVDGVSVDQVERINQIASSQYGIDNMYGGSDSIAEKDEKIFFKLDWNINENHRAFGSYQYTKGNSLSPTDHGGNRFAFLSHWYDRSEKLEAYNFQVFSDWTDNFSTEVKLGYKKNVTGQNGLAVPQGIGEIQIDTVNPNTGEDASVYLGIDDSRHSNALNNKTWQAKIKGDYVVGDHTISAGYEYDSVDVFNLFIQRSKGIWYFDSIDDFESGAPSFFQYQNAATNNADDGAASFKLTTHTAYLQDRWDVSDKLTLTGGVRVDFWKTGDAPALNQAFVDRNGFANNETLDGKKIVQPRFAFSYDIDDKTTLRGGVGRFGGGDPLVWVSNAYSLDGVTILTYDTDDQDVIGNPDFTQVPQAALDGLGGAAAGGDVAAIDPDFEIPSTWKFNLAVDRYFDLGALGNDWHVTLEAIWARTQNAADWKELRREQIGTASDGSAIYNQPSGYDILLTNGEEAKQDIYAISFDKSWDNGLSLFGSYSYMDAEVANEGTSSTASSNYNYAAHLDRSDRQRGTSVFEVKHQVKLGATYKKAFWDDNFTTIGVFYNGRSGKPFSITMDEYMQFGGNRSVESGDGHLLYVPAAGEAAIAGTAAAATAKVVFADAGVRDDFNALVETYGLKRGQSVDLQSERGPWINDLDLRIAQEVGVGFGKVELFMNMENVLNFVNNGWGKAYDSEFGQQALVDTLINADTGQIGYTGVDSSPFFRFQDTSSVWVLQIGAKYKF